MANSFSKEASLAGVSLHIYTNGGILVLNRLVLSFGFWAFHFLPGCF